MTEKVYWGAAFALAGGGVYARGGAVPAPLPPGLAASGPRAPPPFLSTPPPFLAVVFMLPSLTLAIFASPPAGGSLVEEPKPAEQHETTPAPPDQPPPAPP